MKSLSFTVPALAALAVSLSFGLALACGKTGAPPAAAPPAVAPGDPHRIEIAVTKKGFQPASVHVPKGTPVTLVFTRKTDTTCATEVVLKPSGAEPIQRSLPLNQPVEIPVSFGDAGDVPFSCAMDMIKGVLAVK
jgi:plastocyanin domain-containing protein